MHFRGRDGDGNRGGEELGCKKKIIHLMIELGASLHYKLSGVADFLTCEVTTLDRRERFVGEPVEKIMVALCATLDLDCSVNVPGNRI